MKKKKVIGLTGGIASGKSMISRYLKELGASVIDADVLSRHLVDQGKPAWREVVEAFGPKILEAGGAINRRELGRIVFQEPEARQKLNNIIHPKVKAMVEELIAQYQQADNSPLIVVDAPLLIEANMTGMVDEVWLVATTEELQIARLMKRDHLNREEACERLNSQMPLQEKIPYAHQVIDNNKEPDKTLAQVYHLWQEAVQVTSSTI